MFLCNGVILPFIEFPGFSHGATSRVKMIPLLWLKKKKGKGRIQSHPQGGSQKVQPLVTNHFFFMCMSSFGHRGEEKKRGFIRDIFFSFPDYRGNEGKSVRET